ncbi:MAG: hypothetical protein ABSF29_07205 [Tepidisphaeraceae bacterium]
MKRSSTKRARRSGWKLTSYRSAADADDADRRFWLSRTPRQRMQALEELRRFNYGYGDGKPQPRFQRILKVTKLRQG